MIGQTVGSYRITQKVSIGGMGTVYKAEHLLIGKLAAVKVLHPELRGNTDVVNRFFNEAKATTQIKHPGIVEVFDFGYLPTGDGYIVMEFLEGMSLARRLKTSGKFDQGAAAMLMRGVCSALGAAHAKQIVHRDLKPDNIFLVPDPDAGLGERPKLLDFGIAKLTESGLAGSGSATKTGAVMGTPTYMSPEQCRGTGAVDHRTDLYSLGCIYYELLTERPPFIEEGAGELIGAHLYVTPEPPTRHEPDISPESEALIMALLQKDPAKRPQTARELGQRYSTIAQQRGWITNTSPTGVTAESLHSFDRLAARRTPVGLDATQASLSGVPVPTPAPEPALEPEPDPEPEQSSQPTTLGGAVGQSASHDIPTRSRKPLWIVGIGVMAAAAATVVVVATSGGHSTTPAKAPPVATMPVTPPAVAPPKSVPVAATPSVAPPVVAPVAPPVVAPPIVAPPVAKPPTPVVATKPSIKVLKHPKDLKKPGEKPVVKPGAGSGSSGGLLIEKDL